MYNTVAKPIKRKAVGYTRLTSKVGESSNKLSSQINSAHQTIKIGNTQYVLSKQLMKPVCDYQNLLNLHSVIKQNINNK